jgi:hypothetical protein
MVQGAPKKAAPKSAKTRNKRAGPKPGVKVIKPKKAKMLAKHRLLKKHSVGLIALTEKNLAERAGHLELLKGGKKDKPRGEKK